MRDYEVVYIFKSSLTTEEIEGRLEGYHAKVLAADGSEITAVEHWGKRQLAYPIDRNDNGYYVVTQFTASPTVLPDYERILKLDEDLLRHLVVLSEGELPVPVPVEIDDDRRRSGGDETRGGARSRDPGAVAADDADDAGDGGDVADVDADDAGDGGDDSHTGGGDDADDAGDADNGGDVADVGSDDADNGGDDEGKD